MRTEYRIDPGRRFIEVSFSGPISTADLAHVRRQFEADPAFDGDFVMLADFTGADFSRMEAPALRARARVPPTRAALAILVGASSVDFGMARMYQLAGESSREADIAVFRGRPEALAWLDEKKRATRGPGDGAALARDGQ